MERALALAAFVLVASLLAISMVAAAPKARGSL